VHVVARSTDLDEAIAMHATKNTRQDDVMIFFRMLLARSKQKSPKTNSNKQNVPKSVGLTNEPFHRIL
jgi:hypothetical protein